MSNISQIAVVRYTLTAADAIGFVVNVPVLWKSPFNDTNYTIGLSAAQIQIAAPPTGTYGTILAKAPTGFTAQVVISGTEGDVIEIQATGTHGR